MREEREVKGLVLLLGAAVAGVGVVVPGLELAACSSREAVPVVLIRCTRWSAS